MKRFLLPAVVAAALVAPAFTVAAMAQAEPAPGVEAESQVTEFAAVRVNDREVMRLAAAGEYSAPRRAETVRQRIREAFEHEPDQETIHYQPSDISVQTVSGMPVIRIKDANLVTVTHADAKLLGKDAQTLAQLWASELRTAVKDVELTREEALPRNFVTIATGTLRGGGAGTAPEEKPKEQKDKKKNEDKSPHRQ